VSVILLMLRHELQDGSTGEVIPAAALVADSGLAPSTITGLMRTAHQAGLIRWTARHGAALTKAGRQHALAQLRRHRLVETYLHTALSVDWAVVHEEATRIDAAVSDLVIERMAAALGHPTHDPHGDPIPDAAGNLLPPRACCRPHGGTMPRTSGPVTGLAGDCSLRVEHIVGHDPAFLRLLGDHGIRPGGRVRITANDPVGGTLSLLASTGRELTLAVHAGERIHAAIAPEE